MFGRRQIASAIVIMLILVQGSALAHDLDHFSPSENDDCVFCLKLEQQKHGLVASAQLIDQAACLQAKISLSPPSFYSQQRTLFRSRAPPRQIKQNA
jgi:hypothetical protein